MVSRNYYLRAGPLQQEHMIDRVLLREQSSALSEYQHRRSGRIEAVRAGVALDASWRVAAAECARLRCVVAEAKRASHVADSGGGGNHAAVCSELRSAEAREVELHKLLAASLCEMGALIHEWAPATLESRPSVLPTAAPFGALGNHGGNSHIALRLAARRGYELLPCALHADLGAARSWRSCDVREGNRALSREASRTRSWRSTRATGCQGWIFREGTRSWCR